MKAEAQISKHLAGLDHPNKGRFYFSIGFGVSQYGRTPAYTGASVGRLLAR